jgi:hypothetical protein
LLTEPVTAGTLERYRQRHLMATPRYRKATKAERDARALPLHDWFSIGSDKAVGTLVAGARHFD